MSGIYLYFDPHGVTDTDHEKFRARTESRITRFPGKSVDLVRGNCIAGASAHFGIMPSGGVAVDNAKYLIATGSCWIKPDATDLATPDAILNAWGSDSAQTRAPFGGVFALARCDDTTGELIVESDRFAALPVYFRQSRRGLAVATEIKFLTGEGNETIDQDALAEMLALGHLLRPHTLIGEIHRLPARSRLICNPGLADFTLPEIGYPRNRKLDRDSIAEYDAIIQRSLRRYSGLTTNSVFL